MNNTEPRDDKKKGIHSSGSVIYLKSHEIGINVLHIFSTQMWHLHILVIDIFNSKDGMRERLAEFLFLHGDVAHLLRKEGQGAFLSMKWLYYCHTLLMDLLVQGWFGAIFEWYTLVFVLTPD